MIAVPKLMGTKNNATAASIKQDIATITTSIQSYYMSNNGIDKISDSVNINPKRWTLTDKKIEFKINNLTCIAIEVNTSNQLVIDIDESSSQVCQKLYDDGIRDTTYNLY